MVGKKGKIFKPVGLLNCMEKFNEKYTTEEKKTEDEKKPEKDQTEKNKTILSEDAFALGNVLQELVNKIEHTRVSLIK